MIFSSNEVSELEIALTQEASPGPEMRERKLDCIINYVFMIVDHIYEVNVQIGRSNECLEKCGIILSNDVCNQISNDNQSWD